MGKLRDEAEALGIEIDGRWSNGTLQRKINEVKTLSALEKARNTAPKKKVKVRLLKHHKPAGWYNVCGHFNENEEFIEGEMAPPSVPGAVMEHKLWANTVVELPEQDAKRLIENIAVQTVIDRDPETKIATGKRQMKTRKPLAELQYEWDGKVEYAG